MRGFPFRRSAGRLEPFGVFEFSAIALLALQLLNARRAKKQGLTGPIPPPMRLNRRTPLKIKHTTTII